MEVGSTVKVIFGEVVLAKMVEFAIRLLKLVWKVKGRL